jgi:hypothetical protein
MARDPLAVVRQVRARTVEQARRDLAACLAAEAALAEKLEELDRAANRDRAAYGITEEAFRFQDMLQLRREAANDQRDVLLREQKQAEARSQAARAVLVAARVAAEAVTTLIGERASHAAGEAARKEQAELEEINRCRNGTRTAPD